MKMVPLRIGIIGLGKIAVDQHIPAITANPRFLLVAAASRNSPPRDGLAHYRDHREMLAREKLDAVAICTPPAVRYEIARDALESGAHCLLEKPPGLTLGEVVVLERLAAERQLTLFTTWHAQYNPAVAEAARLLQGLPIVSMRIDWLEDVRKWHPGQQWIWLPGGFGVFDPGINALSIATAIFPGPLLLRSAKLFFPENRQTPIAAEIRLASPSAEGPLEAYFDWRHERSEQWTIAVQSREGALISLREGGARLFVGEEERPGAGLPEYAAIYARFVDLIDERRSLVDIVPLRLAADAFLAGERVEVAPFEM